jgi:hypothetical protein
LGFIARADGSLTGKALESGVKISDGGSVDIADISHQVGNLEIIRGISLQSQPSTYIASAIGHLLVNVVVSDDLVDYVGLAIEPLFLGDIRY